MKLDFSKLAKPVAKARGQAGITGTPASTRVCTFPLAQPGAGTTGGKPTAVTPVAELVVAAPAACPLVSPVCPQVTDAEKPNAGAVSPASPQVPVEATQGAAAAPLGAGLISEAEDHGIDWPPEGYGANFPAFEVDLAPLGVEERPYRLSVVEADAAHAQAWTETHVRLYSARAARCRSLGYTPADAYDLAERLHLRDATGDDRRACVECRHFEHGHCTRHRAALLASNEVGHDLAALPQRCPAHAAAFESSGS
jgi:hypothetical protein